MKENKGRRQLMFKTAIKIIQSKETSSELDRFVEEFGNAPTIRSQATICDKFCKKYVS